MELRGKLLVKNQSETPQDLGIGDDIPGASPFIQSLSALTDLGILVKSGLTSARAVSLIAPAEGIGLTNPNGTSGNIYLLLRNDLAAIEAVTGTGYLKRTAVDTWTVDNSQFLTANQSITLSGDITGTGTTAITCSLVDVGTPVVNTLAKITTDVKGRVTSAVAADLNDFLELGLAPVHYPSFTGNATIGGNLTVAGHLTFSGSSTIIESTVITLDDVIMNLGGNSAPVVNDGKDRGISFRWHDGVDAKIGFFGFKNSSRKLTFIPDATIENEVASGTEGVMDIALAWTSITNKPTTVAGYGITDAVSTTHLTDQILHLTSSQNTWLDAISVTSAEVNYLANVTSNVQTQLNALSSVTSNALLQAILGCNPTANKLLYFSGPTSVNLTDLSLYMRSLLDDTDYTAAQTTLHLTPGIDIQAWDINLEDLSYIPEQQGLLTRTIRDSDFSQVSLLLLFNGVNSATSFQDDSKHQHSIINHGNTKLSTSVKKSGNTSVQFNGIDNYLTVNAHTSLNISEDDFTIELHVYLTSSSDSPHLIELGTFLTNRMTLLVESGVYVLHTHVNSDSGNRIVGSAPTLNTWQHLALVKYGSMLYFYVDGIEVGSALDVVLPTGNLEVCIGWQKYSGHNHDFMQGYLDNIRISTVARYTDSFTPSDTYTGSGWFLDTNTYLTANQTITLTGAITGSGSTSITTVLADSGVNAGTYTKLTVNAKGLATVGGSLEASDIPNLSWNKITTDTPTTLTGYGITDAVPSSHLSDATIHLTSDQNTLLDGITVTSTEINHLANVTSNVQTQLNAKQTSNEALTAISAVSGAGILEKYGDVYYNDVGLLLLGNGLNGDQIFTDSSPLAQTVVYEGTVQIFTGIRASSCIGFDGTEAYLKIPSENAITVGSGNWTIEFWVNFNALGPFNLYDQRVSASDNGIYIQYTAESKITIYRGTTLILTSTILPIEKWHFIALTKNGSTFTLYVNGKLDGTVQQGSLLLTGTSGDVYIGAANPTIETSNYFNGYLDDFRITNICRYTTQFTAPLVEFPSSAPTWVLLDNYQPYSTSLTQITLMQPSANDFMLYDGQQWQNKTPDQVKTVLGLDHIFTAGNGIEIVSYTLNVKLDTNSYMEVSSSGLKAQVVTDITQSATGKLADSLALKTYIDTAIGGITVFPSQTGKKGHVLMTDGTNPYWSDHLVEFAYLNLGTNLTVVNSVPALSSIMVEYVITAIDNSNGNIKSCKILISFDGATAYYNEHAIILSNNLNDIVNYTVSYNGGNIELEATGVTSNITIKGFRTILN